MNAFLSLFFLRTLVFQCIVVNTLWGLTQVCLVFATYLQLWALLTKPWYPPDAGRLQLVESSPSILGRVTSIDLKSAKGMGNGSEHFVCIYMNTKRNGHYTGSNWNSDNKHYTKYSNSVLGVLIW